MNPGPKDYTKTRPLKVVTIRLGRGDLLHVVARYDRYNDAWYSEIGDVSEAIHNARYQVNDQIHNIGDLIDDIVSSDVARFYIGKIDCYSTGEICQHIATKVVGAWRPILRTRSVQAQYHLSPEDVDRVFEHRVGDME